MSAAVQAVLVEKPPPYLETQIAPLPVEEAMRDLVHELRQPLSSIEAIAYYLEMTLPAEQFQARQYMRRIQLLVDEASLILNSAVSPVRKPCGSATV
jgi:nitrogen-specific signal transduction histidine kinase